MARAPSDGAPLNGRRFDAVVFDLFGTLVPEYCGDGAYDELSGAGAVGITAYLIRDAELSADALRPDAEEWPGPAIEGLRDLLELLP